MAADIHDGSSYRGRYYDPSAGRFISEAPKARVAFDGSDVSFLRLRQRSQVVFMDPIATGFQGSGKRPRSLHLANPQPSGTAPPRVGALG
jgi:hypothetical protein